MDLVQVLLPALTLIIGAALTFGADTLRQRSARRMSRDDALHGQRAAAYAELADQAHLAAHTLGRTAPGCPHPLSTTDEVYWRIDSDVARAMRRVRLIGSEDALHRAVTMVDGLRAFRSALDAGAAYNDDDYLAAFHLYRDAREAFLEVGRLELIG